jgi:hypothetical protein
VLVALVYLLWAGRIEWDSPEQQSEAEEDA